MASQTAIRKPSTKGAQRRRIQFAGELEDGYALYTIKSRTAEGKTYSPTVDLATGQVWCDCPHFTYRMTPSKLGHEPCVADAEKLCHHLQRAINEARRKERF